MRLPLQSLHLEPRENGNDDKPSRSSGTITFTVIFSVLACSIAIGLIYATLRGLRYRNASPKYIPTKYLKRKWEEWRPSGFETGKYHRTPREGEHLSTFHSPANQQEQAETDDNDDNARVDRHTSVRSIATLPAYKPTARDTERILGREGERAGIDVVIEFPETAEEEENRREEDMEALYQIRLARRVEAAEREERRRQRREARERGDTATLEALRRESRARAESAASPGGGSGGTNLVNGLSVEQATPPASRERRISSVSYADVGLARHDGSRVRASSDSDQHPLLEGAAPMGGNGPTSRPSSPYTFITTNSPHQHARHRNSSVQSISTINTSELPPPSSSITHRPPHSRSVSATSNVSYINTTPIPTPEETSDEQLPPPPNYDQIALAYQDLSQDETRREEEEITIEEEAPPYESPTSPTRRNLMITNRMTSGGSNTTTTRQTPPTQSVTGPPRQPANSNNNNNNIPPRLPSIRHLPAIEIIPASAVDGDDDDDDDNDRSISPSAIVSPMHERRGEVVVGGGDS